MTLSTAILSRNVDRIAKRCADAIVADLLADPPRKVDESSRRDR